MNKKAMSPVVAAIILIAVTIAVSIAVASWMGSLTFSFMGTEALQTSPPYGWNTDVYNEIKPLTCTYTRAIITVSYRLVCYHHYVVYINVVNTGTLEARITTCRINDGTATVEKISSSEKNSDLTLVAGEKAVLEIIPSTDMKFQSGCTYDFKLYTGRTNQFWTRGICP